MPEPTAVTIALDTATDDLGVPFRLIAGRDAYAQRLRDRFRFFLGEWFLDLRLGVPYYQRVLTKPVDERVARIVLTQVIESCPGTLAVTKVNFTFDRSLRMLIVDELEIQTTDGSFFVAAKEEFIITLPIAQE